MTIWLAMRR